MEPIYLTGYAGNGTPLFGGFFTMKDQVGLPLDMSYEICKEHGILLDYCDLLCAAWLDSPFKYDSICAELKLIVEGFDDIIMQWKLTGVKWLNEHPEALKKENPIDEFCKSVLKKKQLTQK